MKKLYLIIGLLISVNSTGILAAEDSSGDAGGMSVTRDVSYVPVKLDRKINQQQTLDIYRRGSKSASQPTILYVHGGGWAFGDKADVNVKPDYFTRQGFAFVSMNYRLRWDYKIYDQLNDVVSAISWTQKHGAQYGLDGQRIVLMGHAAGGHLVSLVATERGFLRAESISPRSIKAVVSIDSNSYDINLLMDMGNFVEKRQHTLIFSAEPAVWKSTSPVTHVSRGGSLPAFALLFNQDRDLSLQQARAFSRALRDANAQVIMIAGSVVDPERTDELIGTDGHVPTGALMAFLRSQI